MNKKQLLIGGFTIGFLAALVLVMGGFWIYLLHGQDPELKVAALGRGKPITVSSSALLLPEDHVELYDVSGAEMRIDTFGRASMRYLSDVVVLGFHKEGKIFRFVGIYHRVNRVEQRLFILSSLISHTDIRFSSLPTKKGEYISPPEDREVFYSLYVENEKTQRFWDTYAVLCRLFVAGARLRWIVSQ